MECSKKEEGVLTIDMIRCSVSNPAKCGLTGKVACLNVDLSGKGLSDIEALSRYDKLQSIDASSNRIREFSCLSKIFMMKKLDLSNNMIESLSPLIIHEDEKKETMGSRALEILNLSSNQIKNIEGALGCMFLKSLRLDNNSLKRMGGRLENLKFLQTLSISKNKLLTTKGISGLNLRVLDLSGNKLDTLGDVFKSLPNVRDVNLSNNSISSLENLSHCKCLRKLNITKNQIMGIRQIEYLSKLKRLESLDLSENQVCNITDYRSRVMFRVSQILQLDGVQISSKDKVLAFNVYGVDLKQRRETHEKHVPEFSFVHPFRKWIECRDEPKLRWCVKRKIKISGDDNNKDEKMNEEEEKIHVVLEAWDEGEAWEPKQEFEEEEENSTKKTQCEGIVLRAFEVSTERAFRPVYMEQHAMSEDILEYVCCKRLVDGGFALCLK
jgi:Leucine-rich repeat (LRR) protein